MPIIIHPISSNIARAEVMRDYFLHDLIEDPLDTTLATVRMIFGGALELFPNLQICLAYGGECLAWALERMSHGCVVHSICSHNLGQPPNEFLSQFYINTIVHSPEALKHLITIIGVSRGVCESDYPLRDWRSPLRNACTVPEQRFRGSQVDDPDQKCSSAPEDYRGWVCMPRNTEKGIILWSWVASASSNQNKPSINQ